MVNCISPHPLFIVESCGIYELNKWIIGGVLIWSDANDIIIDLIRFSRDDHNRSPMCYISSSLVAYKRTDNIYVSYYGQIT